MSETDGKVLTICLYKHPKCIQCNARPLKTELNWLQKTCYNEPNTKHWLHLDMKQKQTLWNHLISPVLNAGKSKNTRRKMSARRWATIESWSVFSSLVTCVRQTWAPPLLWSLVNMPLTCLYSKLHNPSLFPSDSSSVHIMTRRLNCSWGSGGWGDSKGRLEVNWLWWL